MRFYSNGNFEFTSGGKNSGFFRSFFPTGARICWKRKQAVTRKNRLVNISIDHPTWHLPAVLQGPESKGRNTDVLELFRAGFDQSDMYLYKRLSSFRKV